MAATITVAKKGTKASNKEKVPKKSQQLAILEFGLSSCNGSEIFLKLFRKILDVPNLVKRIFS